MLPTRNFNFKDTYSQSEGMKKILHANGNQNRAGASVFITNKIDSKSKTVTRDK